MFVCDGNMDMQAEGVYVCLKRVMRTHTVAGRRCEAQKQYEDKHVDGRNRDNESNLN